MSVDLSDFREVCYDILREEQNSSSFPYTLVDLMINTAQQRICTGRVINPLTKETARKWTLPFLNTDRFYANVPTTSLSADTTVWATTLTVADTTNFESTWSLYIAWNIITYTWKGSTTFTWVTWVLFAFKSWMEVSVAFTLPTDYANVINITYNNKFKLEAKNFDDIFEDLNQYKGNNYQRNRANSIYESPYKIAPFYVIKDNAYMILFNMNDLDWIIRLRYEKLPSTLTATTDTTDIDNDLFAKGTVPYLAVWEILYNRWEEARAAEILNFGIWQVKEMYTYYNGTTYEKLNWTQYKIGKSRLNI